MLTRRLFMFLFPAAATSAVVSDVRSESHEFEVEPLPTAMAELERCPECGNTTYLCRVGVSGKGIPEGTTAEFRMPAISRTGNFWKCDVCGACGVKVTGILAGQRVRLRRDAPVKTVIEGPGYFPAYPGREAIVIGGGMSATDDLYLAHIRFDDGVEIWADPNDLEIIRAT